MYNSTITLNKGGEIQILILLVNEAMQHHRIDISLFYFKYYIICEKLIKTINTTLKKINK
jgi:hypothetical protein